jgi:hypothetical protein
VILDGRQRRLCSLNSCVSCCLLHGRSNARSFSRDILDLIPRESWSICERPAKHSTPGSAPTSVAFWAKRTSNRQATPTDSVESDPT